MEAPCSLDVDVLRNDVTSLREETRRRWGLHVDLMVVRLEDEASSQRCTSTSAEVVVDHETVGLAGADGMEPAGIERLPLRRRAWCFVDLR